MYTSPGGSAGNSPLSASTPSRSLFALPPSVFLRADNELEVQSTYSGTSSRSGSVGNQHIQDLYKALGLVDMVDDSSEVAASAEEQEKLVADLVSGNAEPMEDLHIIIGGIPAPEAIEMELYREDCSQKFKEIQPESYDWTEIAHRSDTAFVVRLKTLVNEDEPKAILNVIQREAQDEPAIDIVCKFHELSVADQAPKRYETRILFVYEKAEHYSAVNFDKLMRAFLPPNNFPYFTIEYLDSFLARRKFANGDIEAEEALKVLRHHVKNILPCSSLFLKLCAHYPEECLAELENLAKIDKSLPLTHLGERSLHKLAVSVVNKMKTPEGSLRKAMSVLKIGVEPRDWGYVAFNTLMRLAQDEDDLLRKNKGGKLAAQESQVDLLLSLINVSNLDLLDKVALLMMAGRTPKAIAESPDYAEVGQALRKINNVCTDRRESQMVHSIDLEFTLDLLSLGSTSSCHLVSIILRKCVDHSAFSSGWKIASRMISISKQVFGEVVTLCSKAYFASLKKANAEELGDMWFRRIQWCVERHLPFLNRYPCGLALHVAAHRRDFDCCWRWFSTMREQLAFRLTGYHTSAVLKAASFEEEPSLDKVRDAYSMTPSSERTTFTFIPLVRIWENITDQVRAKHLDFWQEVADNVKSCLNGHDGESKKSEDSPASSSMDAREAAEMGMGGGGNSASAEAQLEKVISKLNHWQDSFSQWKKITSNGTNLSNVSSRRSSHRSSGKGQSGNNGKNRRNSRPRGSGGPSSHGSHGNHGSNSAATSPQLAGSGSFSRRFSENSVVLGAGPSNRKNSGPFGSHSVNSSPMGKDAVLVAPVGNSGSSRAPLVSSDSDPVRRWSGSKESDPILPNSKQPRNRTADRRASERNSSTPKNIAPISRPVSSGLNLNTGSGSMGSSGPSPFASTPILTSFDMPSSASTNQRRGSSNSASASASPATSRNASIQFALSPELFTRPSDKFKDADDSTW